jgi:hypothetical protein
MVTAGLRLVQVSFQGASDDFIGLSGFPVLCLNNDDSNITSWLFELIGVPAGSSLSLGTLGTTSTVTFTPDIQGEYFIRLTVSGGGLTSVTEEPVAIVLTRSLQNILEGLTGVIPDNSFPFTSPVAVAQPYSGAITSMSVAGIWKLIDRLGAIYSSEGSLTFKGLHVSSDGSVDAGRIDVRELGFINDGVTDNSTFVAAANAAAATAKCHLYFPAGGNYLFTGNATFTAPCDFAPNGVAKIIIGSSDPTKFFATYPTVILSANKVVHSDWFAALSTTTTSADLVKMRHTIAAAPDGCEVIFDTGDFDLHAYNASTDPIPGGGFGLLDLYGRHKLKLTAAKGARFLCSGGPNAPIFWARGCYHVTFEGFHIVGNFATQTPWLDQQTWIRTDNHLGVEPGFLTDAWTIPVGQDTQKTWIVPLSSPRTDADYKIVPWITKVGGAATGSDTVVATIVYPDSFAITVSTAPGAQNIINYQLHVKAETRDLQIRDCICENFGGNLFRAGPDTHEFTLENCRMVGGGYFATFSGFLDPTQTDRVNQDRQVSHGLVRHNHMRASLVGGRTEGPGGVVTGSDDFMSCGGYVHHVDWLDNQSDVPGADTTQNSSGGAFLALYDSSDTQCSYHDLRIARNKINGSGMIGLAGYEYTPAIDILFQYAKGIISRVTIEDNEFDTCNQGVYIRTLFAGAGVHPVTIRRNHFTSCRNAITVDSPNAVVTDNLVDDCLCTLGDVYHHAISATGANATVFDNRIRSSTGSQITTLVQGAADKIDGHLEILGRDTVALSTLGDIATRERLYIGSAYTAIGQHPYRYYDECLRPYATEWVSAVTGTGAATNASGLGTGAILVANSGGGAGTIKLTKGGGANLGPSDAFFIRAKIQIPVATDYDFGVGFSDLGTNECLIGAFAASGATSKFVVKAGASTYLASTVSIDGNFHDIQVWWKSTRAGGDGKLYLSVDGETPVSVADPITALSSAICYMCTRFSSSSVTQRLCYLDSALWSWNQTVGHGGT